MFGLDASSGSAGEDQSSTKSCDRNDMKSMKSSTTINEPNQDQAVVHALPRGLPHSPAMTNLGTTLPSDFVFERPDSALPERPISYPQGSDNSRSFTSDENNKNNNPSPDRCSSVRGHRVTNLDTATRSVLAAKFSQKEDSESLGRASFESHPQLCAPHTPAVGESSGGQDSDADADAGASYKLSDSMNGSPGRTKHCETTSVKSSLPDNGHGEDPAHHMDTFLYGPDTTAQGATNPNAVNHSTTTPTESHVEQQHDNRSNNPLLTPSSPSFPSPSPSSYSSSPSSSSSAPYNNNNNNNNNNNTLAGQTNIHAISTSTIPEVPSHSTTIASIPVVGSGNPNPFPSPTVVTAPAVQDSQTWMQTPPQSPSPATGIRAPPSTPVLMPATRREAAEETQQAAQFEKDREGYQPEVVSRAAMLPRAMSAQAANTRAGQRRQQRAGGGHNAARTYHPQHQQQQWHQQQILPAHRVLDVQAAAYRLPYFDYQRVQHQHQEHYQPHHPEAAQEHQQEASAVYAAQRPGDSATARDGTRTGQSRRRRCAQRTMKKVMKCWVLLGIMALLVWLLLGLVWLVVAWREMQVGFRAGQAEGE